MRMYKIAVIGAGASGLFAAREAAKTLKNAGSPVDVILLEGNQKIGKKLLATGNGRCNLSNKNLSTANYHGDTELLDRFLAENSSEKIVGEFQEMGLLCKPDSDGRIYPRNLQAAAVLKVLKNSCEELGVFVRTEFNVFSVTKVQRGFVLKAENGEEISSEKCIIACGGMASPKHSCGVNGYEISRKFGHTITFLVPSLVQLMCRDKRLKSLKGMRCKAKASLLGDGELIASESGEVIFSDKSISGICIFNLSSFLSEQQSNGTIKGKKYKKLEISLDIAEEFSIEEIKTILFELQRKHPDMQCRELLSGIVNIRVGEEIMKFCVPDLMLSVKGLNPHQISKIAETLKNFSFEITGPGNWENAQITSGGIPLSEIDMPTMESRRQRGIYFAGEILNVNGDCGGYNLHFAWATGLAAGKSAAEKIIYV